MRSIRATAFAKRLNARLPGRVQAKRTSFVGGESDTFRQGWTAALAGISSVFADNNSGTPTAHQHRSNHASGVLFHTGPTDGQSMPPHFHFFNGQTASRFLSHVSEMPTIQTIGLASIVNERIGDFSPTGRNNACQNSVLPIRELTRTNPRTCFKMARSCVFGSANGQAGQTGPLALERTQKIESGDNGVILVRSRKPKWNSWLRCVSRRRIVGFGAH